MYRERHEWPYYLGAFLGFVLLFLLGVWLQQIAWNAVVPSLFHGPRISFTQSTWLSVLEAILAATFRK